MALFPSLNLTPSTRKSLAIAIVASKGVSNNHKGCPTPLEGLRCPHRALRSHYRSIRSPSGPNHHFRTPTPHPPEFTKFGLLPPSVRKRPQNLEFSKSASPSEIPLKIDLVNLGVLGAFFSFFLVCCSTFKTSYTG